MFMKLSERRRQYVQVHAVLACRHAHNGGGIMYRGDYALDSPATCHEIGRTDYMTKTDNKIGF